MRKIFKIAGIVFSVAILGGILYTNQIQPRISGSATQLDPDAAPVRSSILKRTLPPVESTSTPVRIQSKNHYSFQYLSRLYDISNTSDFDVDALTYGQAGAGFQLNYKNTKAIFLSLEVRNGSVESLAREQFQGGQTLESTVDGHKALTKVYMHPYDKILASVVTFVDVGNDKKTLMIFSYPHSETDVEYYNQLLDSIRFQ